MNYNCQKIKIFIDNDTNKNWRFYLQDQLKDIKSKNIEIDCGGIDLMCTEILEMIRISEKFNCKINSFIS